MYTTYTPLLSWSSHPVYSDTISPSTEAIDVMLHPSPSLPYHVPTSSGSMVVSPGRVGAAVGPLVGGKLGVAVGALVRRTVGCAVGGLLGAAVGTREGALVGTREGTLVGAAVGVLDGAVDGETVGAFVAARHFPAEHTPLSQSRSTKQSWPAVQTGQVPPPQSTSVSCSPLTPSAQLIAVGDGVGDVVGVALGAGLGARVAHSRSVFTVAGFVSYS
jgi:hypothetical protein